MITKINGFTMLAFGIMAGAIAMSPFVFAMPRGGEEEAAGPVVRLQMTPGGMGVLVYDQDGRTGGFGHRFDNSQVLPGRLFQPAELEVYSIPGPEDPRIRRYVLRMGFAGPENPADHVVYTTWSEEYRIPDGVRYWEVWLGPLEAGTTQVVFR